MLIVFPSYNNTIRPRLYKHWLVSTIINPDYRRKKANSPGRIRTSVAGSKDRNDCPATTRGFSVFCRFYPNPFSEKKIFMSIRSFFLLRGYLIRGFPLSHFPFLSFTQKIGQLFKGPGPMGIPVLILGLHFGKCPFLALWNENRIVSKTVLPF